MNQRTPAYWIEHHGLLPHPEGGYYAETYRCSDSVDKIALPARFRGARSFSTGIYFLLERHQFSAFHKIHSDEMWHFYAGAPLEIWMIDPASGELGRLVLGADAENGQVFQAVVPAGFWFGSRPVPGGAYALVGCTVAPGFDFEDLEMAERETLLTMFPAHEEIIHTLTR
jgi:uncharacterized protein